jgi:outer membrane protein assembly factor BamA
VRDKLHLKEPEWVILSKLNEGVTRLYDTGRFRTVEYRLDRPSGARSGPDAASGRGALAGRYDDAARALVLHVSERRLAELGIGYRYDSRYKASLLGSAVVTDPLGRGSRAAVNLRLGEQGLASGDLNWRFGHTPEFFVAVGALYKRMPFDIYSDNLRVGSPQAYVGNFSLTGGIGIGNGAVLAARVKGEYADNEEFSAIGEPFTGEKLVFYTVAPTLHFDYYDRAAFPRSGAGGLLKAEWGDPASKAGPTFTHQVMDLHAAIPLYPSGLSLLTRFTLGGSAGELPDHYYFFLGGANSYYLYPDRHFPFAGLRTMQRNGRYLQSLQVGVQYELHPFIIGRFRWNAGATLNEWKVDADLLTYGFDITLGAVTRFGNGAVGLVGTSLGSMRVVIDVGFPF